MTIAFGLVGIWRPPVPMGDVFPVRSYMYDGGWFWFGGNLAPTRPDGRRVPGPDMHDTIDIVFNLVGTLAHPYQHATCIWTPNA